jgi:hypothetical protein
MERAGELRGRLQLAAMIYLVLVAAAFVYLAFLKSRVQKLERQLAETQPQVEFVQAQEARWKALAPAVEPGRYTVELLYLLQQSLPTPEVKITEVNHTPTQFGVTGEAPAAPLAIEYVEKLRAEPALKEFKIELPQQPRILPNGTASFSIFGKL